MIEAEQFIATNILEWSKFTAPNQRVELMRLIGAYNMLIDRFETDPSLLIGV